LLLRFIHALSQQLIKAEERSQIFKILAVLKANSLTLLSANTKMHLF
jgi:hypothetical protein